MPCTFSTEQLRSLSVTWFELITALISKYINYKVWNEITYQFPNFNGCTVEVWEWIINFIQHFIGHVVTYPCWEVINVSTRGPWCDGFDTVHGSIGPIPE